MDASALLLDALGKVRGDADLVFHNQPAHPSGAVRHAGTADGGGQSAEWLELELDLPRIEPEVRARIEGAGDWSLRLLPVEQARPLTGTVEGSGSTVLGYTGPSALVHLRRTTTAGWTAGPCSPTARAWSARTPRVATGR